MSSPIPKLDWEAVLQLRNRPKLDEVCLNPRALFSHYYQIGPTEYVSATFTWRDTTYSEEGVFVSRFYWAPSVAAFRRATTRSVVVACEDDGKLAPLPKALQMGEKCTTYQTLRDYIMSQKLSPFRELDEIGDVAGPNYNYEWVRTGHCLRTRRWAFFFRSPSPVPPDAKPYAFAYDSDPDSFVDARWSPTD